MLILGLLGNFFMATVVTNILTASNVQRWIVELI